VRVIRHQAEGIQVGCDSFQHADHPRPVESNKLGVLGTMEHNPEFGIMFHCSQNPSYELRGIYPRLPQKAEVSPTRL
jgi:hypothetical protein